MAIDCNGYVFTDVALIILRRSSRSQSRGATAGRARLCAPSTTGDPGCKSVRSALPNAFNAGRSPLLSTDLTVLTLFAGGYAGQRKTTCQRSSRGRRFAPGLRACPSPHFGEDDWRGLESSPTAWAEAHCRTTLRPGLRRPSELEGRESAFSNAPAVLHARPLI